MSRLRLGLKANCIIENSSYLNSQFLWMIQTITLHWFKNVQIWLGVCCLTPTFNNISSISWRSLILMEETGVLERKPPTCHKSGKHSNMIWLLSNETEANINVLYKSKWWVSEWVICSVTPTHHFFSYIKNKLIFNEVIIRSALY